MGISQLILCVLAIISSIIGGFAWVVAKMDRLTQKMDQYVKTQTCTALRSSCPCVERMRALQKEFDIRYQQVSEKIQDIKE